MSAVPVVRIVLFTLIPVAVALAAGLIVAWRRPGPRFDALVQHLAAGVVFAAATLELLPRERAEQRLPVIIGFALGVVLMLAIREIELRQEKRAGKEGLPLGLMSVTAVDLLIDGVVLGIGFGIGEHTGILLVAALSLEVLFVGLTIAGALRARGVPGWATVAAPFGISLALVVGAVAGGLLLPHLSPFSFTLLLGTGTVVFLYLVTEELLVEAHEHEDSRWSTPAFFGGFLLFLLLEMSLGR